MVRDLSLLILPIYGLLVSTALSDAPIPYKEYIPPLSEGDVILIRGKIPNVPEADKMDFSLNLCTNPTCQVNALILGREVMEAYLSSFGGHAGGENIFVQEQEDLKAGQEFEMKVSVTKEEFRIQFDKLPEIHPFPHRMDFHEINFMEVRHKSGPPVLLFDIGWEKFSVYNRSISNIKLGDEIRIRGKALSDYYKFAVALCTDEKCTERGLCMEVDSNITKISSLQNNKDINEQWHPTDNFVKNLELSIALMVEDDHLRIVYADKEIKHFVKYDQIRYLEIRYMHWLLQRPRFQLLGVEWISLTTTSPTTKSSPSSLSSFSTNSISSESSTVTSSGFEFSALKIPFLVASSYYFESK